MLRTGLYLNRWWLWLGFVVLLIFGLIAQVASAEEWADKGPMYRVDSFELTYTKEHPGLPTIESLMTLPLKLAVVSERFVVQKDDLPAVTITLSGNHLKPFHYTAIKSINDQIVEHFRGLGLAAITIRPDPRDIDQRGQDLRATKSGVLRLVIHAGRVDKMRTLASGDHIPLEERKDNPRHARLKTQSPVQPSVDKPDATDLLRKDLLDDYLFRLNRHPGRRVDVAIAPGEESGNISLEYLVTEGKPWTVYYHLSNTGTKTTADFRHRFGFIHNQLTGHDDRFTLEYATAGFDASHSVSSSYEAPFFDSERIRWRVNALYAEFTASDVGITGGILEGDESAVGLDLIFNVYQSGRLFIDATAGVRYRNIRVDNQLAAPAIVVGTEQFLLPHIGFQLEHKTRTGTTYGAIDFEWFAGDVLGNTQAGLAPLGRTGVATDSVTMTWNTSRSFYLEPLLNRKAWEDHSSPESSTLAHEVYLGFRGQYSFGERLIPQSLSSLGGFYSVRGYEESTASGDSSWLFTAEYRLHIPRLFTPQPNPAQTPLFGKPFRWAPTQVQGPTDWNLIFRAFIDVGRTFRYHEIAGEQDNFLVGTGVGFELQFKSNLVVRLDWGVALEDAGVNTAGTGPEVDSGDSRVHFSLMLMF